MKNNLFTIVIILLSFCVNAQNDSTLNSTTDVIIYTNWSNTFRRLEENEGLAGDSLGPRADEKNYNLWSFGFSFRSELTKHFLWEGGISLQKNGEKYSFEDEVTDSLYIYDSQYSYISMPIKLMYTYGNSVKVLLGVGVVPQMFSNFKQDLKWRTALGTETSEDSKTNRWDISFVVSAVFNLGVEMEMSEKWSLMFMPEYKLQLTSSYLKTNSYKHYGRSLGFNIGIAIVL